MKYVCGPSVLQLEGRSDLVQPGAAFDYEFSPSQEATLLAAGAISLSAQVVAAPASRQSSAGRPGDVVTKE